MRGTTSAGGDGLEQFASGDAELTSVDIQVAGLTIWARGLVAGASARCGAVDGETGAVLSSTSAVADVTVNGQRTVVGDAPTDVPLGLLGGLHLNSETRTGTLVTRRALWLNTILGDVVIGEATAGTYGQPCG